MYIYRDCKYYMICTYTTITNVINIAFMLINIAKDIIITEVVLLKDATDVRVVNLIFEYTIV